jgi:hypothetical protein
MLTLGVVALNPRTRAGHGALGRRARQVGSLHPPSMPITTAGVEVRVLVQNNIFTSTGARTPVNLDRVRVLADW